MLRFIYLIIFLLMGNSYGTDNFISGNEAFEKGNYEEAVRLYEESLKEGESAAGEFNLGNSYYMMGKNGYAILHYMRGLVMEPRDADIKTNLKLVREHVGIEEERESVIRKYVNLLRVDEWAMVVVVAFWVILGIVGLRRVEMIKNGYLNPVVYLCIFLVAICITPLMYYHGERRVGVVMEGGEGLHVAPSEESPSLLLLGEGSLGYVHDEHGEFYFIKTDKGKKGWVSKKKFERVL